MEDHSIKHHSTRTLCSVLLRGDIAPDGGDGANDPMVVLAREPPGGNGVNTGAAAAGPAPVDAGSGCTPAGG